MKAFSSNLITSTPLPLVLESNSQTKNLNDFLQMLREEHDSIRRQLLENGGLLFRGFPIRGPDDFSAVLDALALGKPIDYIGGDSPRIKVRGPIYTSTEAPPSIKIPLHNELSFVRNYPKHIYFYCQTAPQKDGETILGDARAIYHAIDEDVKKRFGERELKYQSAYFYKSRLMDLLNGFQRAHKSWIDVFETENREEVETKCRQNEFAFKWNQNDWIQIQQQRPAVLAHPETQEMVWFNQAHLYDFNPKLLGWWRYFGAEIFYCRDHMRLHKVTFADGEAIPREDLYHILEVLDANTIAFPWQSGDLLVLDNILSMHGRATFKGPRRVLTAMTS